MTPKLSGWIKQAAKAVLSLHETSADIFLPNGKPPRAGDMLHQPHLARTYKTLAREGRDAFYQGTLAQDDHGACAADWGRTQYEGYGMGHAQAISINPDTHILEGAADPRCDGLAPGW